MAGGISALCTALQAQQQLCSDAEVPLHPTDWSQTIDVPRFDPNLGILTGVSFQLDGTVEGSARVENLDASPSMVHTSFQAVITVKRPDATQIVLVAPAAFFDDPLAGFDGTIDFGGGSGITHSGISVTATATASSPPPAGDLTLFTGPAGNPGVISLPATAVASSIASGSGNVTSQFMTSASVHLQVCYLYELDCNRNGVPDSTDVLMLKSPDLNQDGVPDECQPLVTSFCEGDGSANGGSDCPCGNDGAPGEGCKNVTGFGGLLSWTGFPSVSNDTLHITASQMPPTTPGMFWFSTLAAADGNGSVFDNGLMCLTVGMRVKKINGGGTFPLPNAPSISEFLGLHAGQTTYFQYWYRDPHGPCHTGSANATNGLKVVWGL